MTRLDLIRMVRNLAIAVIALAAFAAVPNIRAGAAARAPASPQNFCAPGCEYSGSCTSTYCLECVGSNCYLVQTCWCGSGSCPPP